MNVEHSSRSHASNSKEDEHSSLLESIHNEKSLEDVTRFEKADEEGTLLIPEEDVDRDALLMNGPFDDTQRSCTDVTFLGIFILLVIAMGSSVTYGF